MDIETLADRHRRIWGNLASAVAASTLPKREQVVLVVQTLLADLQAVSCASRLQHLLAQLREIDRLGRGIGKPPSRRMREI